QDTARKHSRERRCVQGKALLPFGRVFARGCLDRADTLAPCGVGDRSRTCAVHFSIRESHLLAPGVSPESFADRAGDACVAMAETPLRSRRPYLLRAMHEWISDNAQTPHIVVDASMPGVEVPRQYVQAGKIILNVSDHATSGLALGNDVVRFRARFGAATYDVSVPVAAVLGIYARETGQGMIFSEADAPP